MKGIALWGYENVFIFTESNGVIDLSKPSKWPEGWPEAVSEEFLRSQGYSVFQGTVEELQSGAKKCSNAIAVRWFAEKKLEEMQQLEKDLGSLRSQVTRARNTCKALGMTEAMLRDATWNLERIGCEVYPTPKRPEVAITISDRNLIPTTSGCYFAWEDGRVRYVGKANNLRKRLNNQHHAVEKHHLLSWVELPEKELYFAEAFYIGILRPVKNAAKPMILREHCG